jgi:hypothetical protein
VRTIEIPLMTARELSTAALERAIDGWQSSSDEIPHQDEVIDSLKACIEHSPFRMGRWEVGPHSPSWMKVEGDENVLDLKGPRALAWFENHYLGTLRIPWQGKRRESVRRYGWAYRPGMLEPCPFTGVCYDDDFLEHLIKCLKEGDTVREAFESLAVVAQRLIEAEFDYLTSRDGFLDMAEANGWEFTEEGKWWRGPRG